MTQHDQLTAWRDEIDRVIKRAHEEIFTTKEIQELIAKLCEADGSPLQGIDAYITQCEVEYVLPKTGICEGTDPTPHEDPLTTEDGFSARVKIRAWTKAGRSVATKHWYDKVVDFLRATWLPEVRERQVGLLDLKSAVVRPRLSRAINRLVKKNSSPPVYAVFIDLDRFKQINTELHHDVGDMALAHVGACIQKIADESHIFGLRNGGDEFSLLVADTPLPALLNLLDKLSTTITAKTFGDKKLTVGMTAGIATISAPYTLEDIDEAIKQAEIVTKDPQTGDKRKRGTVSIASDQSAHCYKIDQQTHAKLATVVARANQQNGAPFANVLLNIISAKASSHVAEYVVDEKISDQIEKFLTWLNVRVISVSYEENLFGDECVLSDLSSVEIAIAIYHGISRAIAELPVKADFPQPRFSLYYGAEDSSVAIVMDENVLWGTVAKTASKLDLGTTIRVNGIPLDGISATVAFQVGFQTRICSPSGRPLPRSLFSEVVVVDDRPKIGGGLPDFWQAGIANIISAIGSNSSFNTLLVVGDPLNAPETTSRIKGDVPLNIDELTSITALKREVVSDCIARLTKPETVKYENDVQTILEHLYQSSLKLTSWSAIKHSIKHERAPKLKRTLDVGPLGLGALDGVKSETASQAYPAIIEIMRTSEAANMTYDDASQPLREIVGFKLVLEAPTLYPIPDYWSEQESAFKEYAEHVLLNTKGVISSFFHEDGQYDAFIKQLAGYCSSEGHDKSTRRAILIVKNIVKNNELRPLGLVSVWAAPRHNAGSCNIEFSFVWRTVEALVGLPYSLYGSIKLAEQIIEAVKSELNSRDGTSPRITAGRLTYLALSLHMRVDEFHKRIAKRIADAASI